MTEPDETTTEHASTADQSSVHSDVGDSPEFAQVPLTTKLQWGALIVLVVAAIVAAIQFYTSSTRAIEVWVGPGYQPLFMAAFNLAVLLLAVAGVSLLTRRLQRQPA